MVVISGGIAVSVGLCAEENIGARLSTRSNATTLIFESVVRTKLIVRIAMARGWLEHPVRASGGIIHSGLGKFGKVGTQRRNICERC